MTDETAGAGLRERLTRQGEDTLAKLAQELIENPLVHGAVARAFEARERASQAQEVAMGALNIPSASDVERLTRRIRSVSQRLEGIEDGVERLDERLAAAGSNPQLEQRLDAIEQRLDQLLDRVGELGKRPPAKSAGAGDAGAKAAGSKAAGSKVAGSKPAGSKPAKRSAPAG